MATKTNNKTTTIDNTEALLAYLQEQGVEVEDSLIRKLEKSNTVTYGTRDMVRDVKSFIDTELVSDDLEEFNPDNLMKLGNFVYKLNQHLLQSLGLKGIPIHNIGDGNELIDKLPLDQLDDKNLANLARYLYSKSAFKQTRSGRKQSTDKKSSKTNSTSSVFDGIEE